MSAYRINYTPEPAQPDRPPIGLALIMLLACAALGFGAFVAILLHPTSAAPVATPVRTPDVVVFPVEPADSQRLVQIRREAFRAGLQAAEHRGCHSALSRFMHQALDR